MIVTLWSVSEASSAFLLQFFYEEIKKQPSDKIDIHSAFITARDRLKHYSWFGSFDSPSHINPFILIDAY